MGKTKCAVCHGECSAFQSVSNGYRTWIVCSDSCSQKASAALERQAKAKNYNVPPSSPTNAIDALLAELRG